MSSSKLVENSLEEVIVAVKAGIPVILMDDADRENEADLIFAAEKITEQIMAKMIRDCSGIVCLCLDNTIADKLELPPMVRENSSKNKTAFTVTIEAREGVTTGVSAADRTTTILTAIADNACAEHLARPGHVFPLRTDDKRLKGRRGHTEGSVFLSEMAGLKPAAVLCELMNEDGTMMRGDELLAYQRKHQFPLISIATLAKL